MKQLIISIVTVAILSFATALPVMADGGHGGHRGEHHDGHGWGGEHDIRHFENHHLPVWRGGNWYHGRHEGRLGWWWIAAGTWYFYPQPVYPYPDPYIPPVIVVQPAPSSSQTEIPAVPPPAQNWYYCEASKSYYPYVSNCPAGWKTVPATPPDTPPK
jgi:hypothetical protein